jgi:uncharacterized protein
MKRSRRPGSLARPGTLIFALFALMLAVTPLATAQDAPTSDSLRLISVSGEGRVTASPDTARVQFGVENRNEALAVAQDEVSDSAEALTEMLLENDIAEDDIETASYDIFPVNEYDRNGNFVGVDHYIVTLSLAVTIRDLDQVGTILDEGVTAGATYVSGISFFVDDPSPYTTQARESAVNEARSKADEYARLSGAIITGVFSLEETSAPAPVAQEYYMEDAAMAVDGAGESRAVPISPGTTEIVVRIQVVYTIEPGNG